jgi:hypothetical protein
VKTFSDISTLKRRIRKIARRLSLSYMPVVQVPTEMHGINYERLGVWCDVHNISVGAVDTKVWILAAMIRSEYGLLARAYPDHPLSRRRPQIEEVLRALDGGVRLLTLKSV